jgi:hypothetical protein
MRAALSVALRFQIHSVRIRAIRVSPRPASFAFALFVSS